MTKKNIHVDEFMRHETVFNNILGHIAMEIIKQPTDYAEIECIIREYLIYYFGDNIYTRFVISSVKEKIFSFIKSVSENQNDTELLIQYCKDYLETNDFKPLLGFTCIHLFPQLAL